MAPTPFVRFADLADKAEPDPFSDGGTARNREGVINRHGYRLEWMEIVQVGADQPAGYIPRPACGCTDKPADYAETG